VWNPENGPAELDKWLSEMKRVLRQNGMIILFESLGTGNEEPRRLEHVEPVYQWLETNGFESKWIRTDYRFESLEEAIELSRFFFGDELGDKVEQNRWVVLPECTGVWWRTI
jgi:ubiquinone/menaquinone biosynthesis C-methylase UbiE